MLSGSSPLFVLIFQMDLVLQGEDALRAGKFLETLYKLGFPVSPVSLVYLVEKN